jgi:hypothetical protein
LRHPVNKAVLLNTFPVAEVPIKTAEIGCTACVTYDVYVTTFVILTPKLVVTHDTHLFIYIKKHIINYARRAGPVRHIRTFPGSCSRKLARSGLLRPRFAVLKQLDFLCTIDKHRSLSSADININIKI